MTLVAGTRRIALAIEDRWYEVGGGRLTERQELGAVLAAVQRELGGLLDVHLGATPIVAGGEDHQETHVRITPTPQRIELPGLLAEVATPRAGIELWRYEHALRTKLATVDAAGAITELPALPRIGEVHPGQSPVSAKLCATPRVEDLAATVDVVAALVTECGDEAPVRIAMFRWDTTAIAPTMTILELPSARALGMRVERVAIGRTGSLVVVGRGEGTRLAIARITPTGEATTTSGVSGVGVVIAAVVADDGAVWTVTVGSASGAIDQSVLARDGVAVALVTPTGHAVRPETLALDDQLGVVVLARAGGTRWIFAEHAPATPAAIP